MAGRTAAISAAKSVPGNTRGFMGARSVGGAKSLVNRRDVREVLGAASARLLEARVAPVAAAPGAPSVVPAAAAIPPCVIVVGTSTGGP